MKTPIVYTTALSNNIRNAFAAWANFIGEKTKNEAARKKAKKKVANDAERLKASQLFIAFTNVCDRENKNFSAVAEELRKEYK